MRFSLRALLIATTFAPPVIAWLWAWAHGRERQQIGYVAGAFLFGLAVSLVILVWRGHLHWSFLEKWRQ